MSFRVVMVFMILLPLLVTFGSSFLQAEAVNKAIVGTEMNQDVRIVPYDDQTSIKVTSKDKERTLTVKKKVEGKDVYVECIVPEFTFSKEKAGGRNVDGEGHIKLYVDGKKIDSIYQGSFIIKGLPTGKHTLKVELVHHDETSYGLEEEFEVTIP